MADPSQKPLDKKIKSEEAARAKSKDLVTKGGLPRTQERADMQKYMDALGSESAARMQEDVIETGIMSNDEYWTPSPANGMKNLLNRSSSPRPDQAFRQIARNSASCRPYSDTEIELPCPPAQRRGARDLARCWEDHRAASPCRNIER